MSKLVDGEEIGGISVDAGLWTVSRDQTDPRDGNIFAHRDCNGHLSLSDRPMLFRNRSVAKKIRQRMNRKHHGQFCEQPFTGEPGTAVVDPFAEIAEFQRGLRCILDRDWDPNEPAEYNIPEFGTPGNSA